MAQSKADVRKRVEAAVAALSPEDKRDKSRAIVSVVAGLPEFTGARVLMLYYPHGHEVAVLPLLERVLAAGKTLVLPKTNFAERKLLPAVITDLATDLVKGAYGIPEPSARCAIREPSAIDFMLAPGRAFDRKGNRIGHGAGFYDRFLAGPGVRASVVAAAFDCQLVGDVPADDYDVPIPTIVTESRILRCTES